MRRPPVRRALTRVLDRARVRYPLVVQAPTIDASGTVAVVTGSSGRLGTVLVDALVAGGADVWGLDRRAPDHKAPDAPVDGVHHIECDLAVPAQVEAAAQAVRGGLTPGRPLLLFHAAGHIGTHSSGTAAPEATAEVWADLYATHVIGPVLLVRALLPDMGYGSSILFVTSVNAEVPSPWPHYSASKAAEAKVVEDLAADLAPQGIRVNAVAPARFNGQGPAQASAESPLTGADVPVEAVAGACLFLASGATSPATTGITLRIDGGLGVTHPRLNRPPR
jgi:2-keto-3-deoxy-L-fuconate dehydrogenase